MKTFQLTGDLLPRSGDDHGHRTMKVYLLQSATFIRDSVLRRGLASRAEQVKGAWEITIDCTKVQFDEIREEFNTRPLGR